MRQPPNKSILGFLAGGLWRLATLMVEDRVVGMANEAVDSWNLGWALFRYGPTVLCFAFALAAWRWHTFDEFRRAMGTWRSRPHSESSPAQAVEALPHDVWLQDAIKYLAFGKWDATSSGKPFATELNLLYKAARDIIQAAATGQLEVYGSERGVPILVKLPSAYWKHYGIPKIAGIYGTDPAKLVTIQLDPKAPADLGARWNLKTSKARIEWLRSTLIEAGQTK